MSTRTVYLVLGVIKPESSTASAETSLGPFLRRTSLEKYPSWSHGTVSGSLRRLMMIVTSAPGWQKPLTVRSLLLVTAGRSVNAGGEGRVVSLGITSVRSELGDSLPASSTARTAKA